MNGTNKYLINTHVVHNLVLQFSTSLLVVYVLRRVLSKCTKFMLRLDGKIGKRRVFLPLRLVSHSLESAKELHNTHA